MLIALLSIAVYMIIMWYVYFYRGFLPRPKKGTQQRGSNRGGYDFDHDQQQQQQYEQQPPSRRQQRPGATMTRSMIQQTMLPVQQKEGSPPHKKSLLNTKFI
mgnify:CR=1 FL=1